jgi:hypothetical protein
VAVDMVLRRLRRWLAAMQNPAGAWRMARLQRAP